MDKEENRMTNIPPSDLNLIHPPIKGTLGIGGEFKAKDRNASKDGVLVVLGAWDGFSVLIFGPVLW